MTPKLTTTKGLAYTLFFACAIFSTTYFTACNKSSDAIATPVEEPAVNIVQNDSTQNINATNNAVMSSEAEEENFEMVMGTGEFVKGSGCQVITYSPSPNVYPHTKTIDYGTRCVGSDGVTIRKGKIHIEYYDSEKEANGRYSLTTYDNYYVDDIKIEGTIKVNKVKNGKNADVYKHITSKTLTDSKGNFKEFNANTDWTLITWEGIQDNAYEITGKSVGKEMYNGVEVNNFQTEIDTKNLAIKPVNCAFRVQGGLKAEINITGKTKKFNEYLDYGKGKCDKYATLSINSKEPVPVTLPLRFWPLD